MTSTHSSVSSYYAPLFTHESALKTNICTIPSNQALQTPKLRDIYKNIHPDILADTFGCGSPIPCDAAIQGCHVLDLGCGSGRDVFTIAALVGPKGRAIGLDMTQEALQKAKEYSPYHVESLKLNEGVLHFQEGKIENLGFVEDNSLDVVISNCVINLSSNKHRVFSEVHRVLKSGGEIYFSDVYSDRRVPDELQNDQELWGECLSGALYWNDFVKIMRDVGFPDIRIVKCTKIALEGAKIKENELVNQIGFYSITVRAFKLGDKLESTQEDYQQEAKYLGNETLVFDVNHTFAPGSTLPVSSNTASILQNSRYASLFEVSEKKAHQGEFQVAQENWQMIRQCEESSDGACCLPTSGESSESSCCPPKSSTSSAGKSCCAPQSTESTEKKSCCAPKTTTEGGEKKSCCAAPKEQTEEKSSCAPKTETKSCCAEKKSCC